MLNTEFKEHQVTVNSSSYEKIDFLRRLTKELEKDYAVDQSVQSLIQESQT